MKTPEMRLIRFRTIWSFHVLALLVSLVFLVFLGATTVFAQVENSQEPKGGELGNRELKDRVRQLEQLTLELKARLSALENAQAPSKSPQVVDAGMNQGGNAVPVSQVAIAQDSQKEDQQKQEPEVPAPQMPGQRQRHTGRATQERETAGQNETTTARIDNEEISPELKGFFRFPGTETLLRLGGFIKTDYFYDINYAGSYYGAYVPSSFPSAPQPHTHDSTVSMRPSRLNFEFRQPSIYGSDVKAYLEWDFLGNYDRNSLHLRLAYAQWKNLLAGQYWSAFGDPDAFPDTLEFEGPPGIMGLRQPQVRYTIPLSKQHSVGFSVEKSGTDIPFSTQFGSPVAVSNRPDLIAFYHYENDHGHLHLAGISRSVGGVITNTTNSSLQAQVEGYGGSISGVWKVIPGTKDNVVFQGILGKGVSNYYNDNFGLGSDVGFDAKNQLVSTPTGSAEGGFQHYWSQMMRSTVSYGYLRINNTAQDPGTNYHVSHYATANIIFQPTQSFLVGGEYIYGWLVRKNGFEWIAPRIQISATYYINKYPRESGK
ncbi:MAG TPA: DcaP family trimeric outer membrane transporter [Candidatus Angelobacter sp.]|nr:DcaP family trimeric outer membrane transporter [Candidatus Angelobacter sp.]